MKRSGAENRAYEEADQRFRERHPECRDGRWSVSGSRVAHCCFCCPPPPMGPKQTKRIHELFARSSSQQEGRKDLDCWDLTLRCDHVVPFVQHREHDRVSTDVVGCPECGERRGVVSSERVGPAYREDGTVLLRAAAGREQLARELAAAEAQLARQQASAAATRRRIAELERELRQG
jgi:hypothetical protein